MSRRELARGKVLIAAINKGIERGYFKAAWSENEVLAFPEGCGESFRYRFDFAGIEFLARVQSVAGGREFSVSASSSDGSFTSGDFPLDPGQRVGAYGFFERERGTRLLPNGLFRCRHHLLDRIAEAPVVADGFYADACDRERQVAGLCKARRGKQ